MEKIKQKINLINTFQIIHFPFIILLFFIGIKKTLS